MTSRLIQFVPTLEPGAVGAHALEVGRLCDELAIPTALFAEHVRAPWTGRGRDHRDYGGRFRADAGDVLLYHVAIGSPVGDFVGARPETLAVDHHNITPAAYFEAWEPAVGHGVAWGRRQLADLAARTTLGLADSDFNRGELDALGYGRTATAPLLLDISDEVDGAALDRLSRHGTVWLFVGRVAPHKAQHDLVTAFSVYRRTYDPDAVLRIVGSSSSDRYGQALHDLVAALDLGGAVEIVGPVTAGELGAHYAAADVFVCLSDHEGFCIPLVEAMHHDLPIVAYGAAAVPETLGDAGIVLPGKSPATVAAAGHRVVSDAALRRALVDAGRRRRADFALDVTRARWRELLAGMLE